MKNADRIWVTIVITSGFYWNDLDMYEIMREVNHAFLDVADSPVIQCYEQYMPNILYNLGKTGELKEALERLIYAKL